MSLEQLTPYGVIALAALAFLPLARFFGTVFGGGRRLDGLEARPSFVLLGAAIVIALYASAAVLLGWRKPLGVSHWIAAAACIALYWRLDWVRLSDDAITARGWSLDRRLLRSVKIDRAGFWGRAAVFCAEGRIERRVSLNMDGLDSILAKLARDGVPMPPWPDVLDAYQTARGRRGGKR